MYLVISFIFMAIFFIVLAVLERKGHTIMFCRGESDPMKFITTVIVSAVMGITHPLSIPLLFLYFIYWVILYWRKK